MSIDEKPGDNSLSEHLSEPPIPHPHIGLGELAVTFFYIGMTSFGGMWGAIKKLESVLVSSKGWLTMAEQRNLMVAATLIPAPKFLAFGGLVGFRLRGWLGGAIALTALIAPPSLFVLAGVILLTPESLGESLDYVRRAVGIGVVGLLIGNAYHQLENPLVTGRNRVLGICLALGVVVAAVAGVPLLLASIIGFVLGGYFMRAAPEETR